MVDHIVQGILCYERPQHHPWISEKEKKFLKEKTAIYLEADRKNVPPTPWTAILTSVPVLALFASLVSINIPLE